MKSRPALGRDMAEMLHRADEWRTRGVGVSTDDIVTLQRELRGQIRPDADLDAFLKNVPRSVR